MPGLEPGIQKTERRKVWMAGTSPAMENLRNDRHSKRATQAWRDISLSLDQGARPE